MEFKDYFPIWDKLSSEQQKRIEKSISYRKAPKGTILHNGLQDCLGLLVIRSGQLRCYIISDEGREITLYRLFDRDICLFTASCMMRPCSRSAESKSIPFATYKARTRSTL